MSDSEVLIALTEQDLAIGRAVKSLDELPEKKAILRLRQRLKEIEEMREKAEAYVRKAESLVKKAEDEAAGTLAKINAEQTKILSGEVANPKELQALTRGLEALQRKKDVIERDEIALMEKAESAALQLGKIQDAITEGAKREEDLISEFKRKGGELQGEIGRMRIERERLAAQLEFSLLERYEKTREAKHGIAVGIFDGRMCSACRMQIPAGQAQALSAGPEIAECPNCRRILIVRGNN